MVLDFTINVGHMLTIVSVFGAMVAAYYDIRRILGDHELRVRLSEQAVFRQMEVNTQIAEALNLIRTDIAVIRVRAERYEMAVDKVTDVVKDQANKAESDRTKNK